MLFAGFTQPHVLLAVEQIKLPEPETAMASPSCAAVDDSFGPYAGDCRGGFDLTLLFEESILALPITALLILAVPCRVAYLLHKGTQKVQNSGWLYCKIVSQLRD